MNILTFDIEEWFHILDNDMTRYESQWNNYEVRIYENVDRILNILEKTNTKATFFIVGWIAKKYPDIVKKISAKYQIGSHTMNHQLVWQQNPEEFKNDVSNSIKQLEDLTGKKIEIFRAPGFSIRETEGWAIDILSELGIMYDCSVLPTKGSHGGIPSYRNGCPCFIEHNGIILKEFPISSKKILGYNVVYCGGGYFRLFPYPLIKKWAHESDYMLSYIHPRDLDVTQPVLEGLPITRKFKSYVGLKKAEDKLKQFVSDFRFIDVFTADQLIDWTNVPTIHLY